MSYSLAKTVVAELDDIWRYIAEESRSVEIADRVIDSLTGYFFKIARNPGIGRSRDDLRHGYRSFAVGQYLILYRMLDDGVEITHVLHGMRDLPKLIQRETLEE